MHTNTLISSMLRSYNFILTGKAPICSPFPGNRWGLICVLFAAEIKKTSRLRREAAFAIHTKMKENRECQKLKTITSTIMY